LVDFFVTFDYVLAEFSLSFLFPVSKGYVSSVARSVSIHFVSNFGFLFGHFSQPSSGSTENLFFSVKT